MTDDIDRPTPSAIEAERALLGGLLQDGVLIVEISRTLSSGDFYRPEHAALFRLLQAMQGAALPIDLVTVAAEMQRGDYNADRFGGLAYVAELPEHAPSTANLAHYAELVFTTSVRRTLMTEADLAVAQASAGLLTPQQVASSLAARVTALAARTTAKRELWSGSEWFEAWRNRKQDESDGSVSPPLPTPFPELNAMLSGGGFSGGQDIVVGGRPGMGKTGFAVALATYWAGLGRPGLFVTIEQRHQEMGSRNLQTQGGIPTQVLESMDPWDLEFDVLASQLEGLYLLDKPGVTMRDIDLRAAEVCARAGACTWVVVDYLQIVKHERERGETSNAYVGRSSMACKELAKKYDCPVIVLSQLNRDVVKRKGAKAKDRSRWWESVAVPEASDLRDSGSIEQDADIILFPLNGDAYGLDTDLGAVIVEKQRNGKTGTVPLRWDGPCATYREQR